LNDGRLLSFADWDKQIMASFEKYYYIPATPEEDKDYNVVPSIIARRGVYKDVVGAYSTWTEYQLRPNLCVAMAVAPELFVHEHAQHALEVVESVLLSSPETYAPIGMKTLDPADWNYCGDYGHGEVDDRKVAGGFNYHQGPEWVWPIGYFLRAKILFSGMAETSLRPLANSAELLIAKERNHISPPLAALLTPADVAHVIHRHLRPHKYTIMHAPYRGLPELTNTNGAHCAASCETQAWSIATVLDALYDLYKLCNKN
jgi:glycogen debranching enzyme